MKHLTVLFLLLFILISGVTYLYVNGSEALDTLAKYQQQHPFSEQEMTFRSTERAFFNHGLILHGPTFPALPFKYKVDRLTLSSTPTRIKMRLNGVVIDIANTLLEKKGNEIPHLFRQITDAEDLLLHPLEAMPLLNRDTFSGNICFTIKFSEKGPQLTIIVEEKNKPIIKFQTILMEQPSHGLWDWVKTPFQVVQLSIYDQTLNQAIASYLQAIQHPLSKELKKAITTAQPYSKAIQLSDPISLSDMFQIKE